MRTGGEEPTRKTRGEQAKRDREMRKQGVERSLQGRLEASKQASK